MAHIGTVTFQSESEKDVFLKLEVESREAVEPDERLWAVEDSNIESDKPYVTGKGPKPVSVNIEGDSEVIYGWFRGSYFPGPFTLNIYVEYEEIEEIVNEQGHE